MNGKKSQFTFDALCIAGSLIAGLVVAARLAYQLGFERGRMRQRWQDAIARFHNDNAVHWRKPGGLPDHFVVGNRRPK